MKSLKNNKRLVHIFLFCTLISCACCCEYFNSSKKYECETPEEVQEEGNEKWNILSVYSRGRPTHFEKDAFKSTPNLRDLLLWSVSSMEPGTFNGLTKLDFLQINSLDLEELPVGILDNLPLRHLGLYGGTRRLPASLIKHLTKIKLALIDNNNINEIKTGVFNNSPIRELYLRNNHLKTIENGAFQNMENLFKLSLTGNNLETFDSDLLLGKNSLEYLWLRKNNIKKITVNMFSNLPKLLELYLDTNEIDTIEDRSFQNLLKLTYLDLSNNNLKIINSNVFPKKGITTLETFLIHNNKLTFINNALYLKFPNLKRISYGGNPLQCPCLEEAQRWTSKRNITRLCDEVYFSGERPACIYSDSSSTKRTCIIDVDLTEDLLEVYIQALAEYPKLNKKCDVTDGYDKAVLLDGTYD